MTKILSIREMDMAKANMDLTKENAELKKKVEQLEYKLRMAETDRITTMNKRAVPVSDGVSGYRCSRCSVSCYYDGRCGDGPILTCTCNIEGAGESRDSGRDPDDYFKYPDKGWADR